MAINPSLLSLLRDPMDGERLEVAGKWLVNRRSQRLYAIDNDIPALLEESALGPQNSRIRKIYQRMAGAYDIATEFGNLATFGGIHHLRRRLAAELRLRPGCKFLYTSIGSGLDLRFLAKQVELDTIEFVGLDLTMQMLRRCQRRLRRYSNRALLVKANAERLPLADGVFDVVLQVGGIKQFDRPEAAVREMVRVAKPGARLWVVDETGKMVKNQYQRKPLLPTAFNDRLANIDPRRWLPAEVKDVDYREMALGRIYFMAFTAPATASMNPQGFH